jgi:hypothetical protein
VRCCNGWSYSRYNHKSLWLWVPAFAGTTEKYYSAAVVSGVLAPAP